MPNILDYIKWRGDLSFRERDVNLPDVIVLSQFVLLNLDNVVETAKVSMKSLRDKMYALKREDESVGLLAPMNMKGLMNAAADSPRFSNVLFHDRIDVMNEKEDMQITAMTADLPSGARIVIFSGTGDTIIAWKEDFNLMYKVPTPSQTLATEYLDKMAKGFHGDLYVCGHSKGGNLTLYSAVHCSERTQKKIKMAYSLDGPGLAEKDLDSMVNAPVYEKILSIIPNGSIVGRLFYHKERVFVVESENKGLYQHDAFNWQISGTQLVKAETTNEDSDKIAELTKNVIEGMDEETRGEYVEALYKMLFDTKAKTLTELASKDKELLGSFNRLNADEKKVLMDITGKLLAEKTVRKLLVENIVDTIKDKIGDALEDNAADKEKKKKEAAPKIELNKPKSDVVKG